MTVKLTLKINSVINKIQKFTAVGIDSSIAELIIPLVTTKSCQTTLYWTGPSSSFKVFAPGVTDVNSSPTYSFGTGTQINFNAYSAGTWYIAIRHNIYFWAYQTNTTVRMTTDSTNACTNYCSLKGVQMVPGTTTN